MILPYQGKHPDVGAATFVAPSADVIGHVTLGAGSSIWYQCVLRGDLRWIQIGARSNVQDGAIVHVESGSDPTEIGDGVTVGHRVILHGCRVGDGCLIGMGAILLSGVEVGEGSVIAAGAVLREGFRVPPGSLVAGVPAVVKRSVGVGMLARIQRSADQYVELAAAHAQLVGHSGAH